LTVSTVMTGPPDLRMTRSPGFKTVIFETHRKRERIVLRLCNDDIKSAERHHRRI
jgi:hypothetical protein